MFKDKRFASNHFLTFFSSLLNICRPTGDETIGPGFQDSWTLQVNKMLDFQEEDSRYKVLQGSESLGSQNLPRGILQ